MKPENKSGAKKQNSCSWYQNFESFASNVCVCKLMTASWFTHMCSFPMVCYVICLLAVHERYLFTGALDSCSIGIYTQTNCHKSSYTENCELIWVDNRTTDKCLLSLHLHTGHEEQELFSLCFHHRMVYLEQWFLTGLGAPPTGHQKMYRGNKTLFTLQHRKFDH